MLVYCAFENDNLVRLETKLFFNSCTMNVSGTAYTTAKNMFDADFVHNALLMLVFGCNSLPSDKDIVSAYRKAEKYAVSPFYAKIRRSDGVIVNVFNKLSYKEVQELIKDKAHELHAVYCLDDLDVYGDHCDALDRNGILSIRL